MILQQDDLIFNLEEMIKENQFLGEPYKLDDLTFIPIIDTIVGFGMGSKDMIGAGGGASLNTRAIIIIKDNHEISFIDLKDNSDSRELKERIPEIIGSLENII
ncbi:GerW family sporulation protein [Orenia marismortui]|uniref:Sporulation protein YtfJ n=1 Tax=Orenia marismortui TaxID=46469 RepID=A0A4R8H3B9_9FIRM|nr:spore germination protein GerW family protein [Orenia marismortui]TDX49213.1 sporulation protein YtfJ [Orenia marismortui]